MNSLARSCLGRFVYVLKASFWNVDLGPAATMYYHVMASGDLELNGSRHHVRPRVDLGAAATMYYVMASGDLELNGSTHHVPCVDLGAAATMYYVMASGDLELNFVRRKISCSITLPNARVIAQRTCLLNIQLTIQPFHV